MFHTSLRSLFVFGILTLVACSGAQNSLSTTGTLPGVPSSGAAPDIAGSRISASTAKIASITLTLQNPSPAQCGPTVSIPLQVIAKDSTGKVITGTYSSPIALSDSDGSGATKLSTTSVTSSSTLVNVTYNGSAISPATFSASSSGVPPSNVHNAILTPTQLLYVGNNGSVTMYPVTARNNVAPIRIISGSSTKLSGKNVTGVAHDTKCNLYVDNASDNAIYKYAAGANGNVAPIATITGTSTQLSSPLQLAVDNSGKLYVNGSQELLEFAPNATGNVAPVTIITSQSPCGDGVGFANPYGVALDSTNNIYVSNESNNCIAVFAPGAHGKSVPIRTIGGPSTGMDKAYGPWQLAIGPSNKTYVAQISYYFGQQYFAYASGANGNVAPVQKLTFADGYGGIAVSSPGNIFISENGKNRIAVFAPTATGNAAPLGYIGGSSTQLKAPFPESI